MYRTFSTSNPSLGRSRYLTAVDHQTSTPTVSTTCYLCCKRLLTSRPRAARRREILFFYPMSNADLQSLVFYIKSIRLVTELNSFLRAYSRTSHNVTYVVANPCHCVPN